MILGIQADQDSFSNQARFKQANPKRQEMLKVVRKQGFDLKV